MFASAVRCVGVGGLRYGMQPLVCHRGGKRVHGNIGARRRSAAVLTQ